MSLWNRRVSKEEFDKLVVEKNCKKFRVRMENLIS